ncbi:hypothetical protein ACE6H2_016128 [Prunus campanulata]
MNFHAWIAKTERRRTEPAKFLSKPAYFSSFPAKSQRFAAGTWLGLEGYGGPVILVPAPSTLVAGCGGGGPKSARMNSARGGGGVARRGKKKKKE